MAKKKKSAKKAGQAGIQSQLRGRKGVNVKRDARRLKGGAGVVAFTKGAGSGKFRRKRGLSE